jgi:hypothetical protein
LQHLEAVYLTGNPKIQEFKKSLLLEIDSSITFVRKFPTTMSPIKASHIAEPPVKVKPSVDLEILTSISPATLEDSFVYVHCYYDNPYQDMMIRIWRSTFLIDKASGSRSKLIHIENISFAPVWTKIPDGSLYSFLLVFEGLPKSCQNFDMIEDIPQAGGFEVRDVARNTSDVYHLDI